MPRLASLFGLLNHIRSKWRAKDRDHVRLMYTYLLIFLMCLPAMPSAGEPAGRGSKLQNEPLLIR